MLNITPDIVIQGATALVALFAFYFANRSRTKVEAFFTHSASHPIPGTPNNINTHSLVIRNLGNTTATNIHITHDRVPEEISIDIYPRTQYRRNTLDGGGAEIIIERLRPKEQYRLSYLYPPSYTYSSIGTAIKHDGGLVRPFEVDFVKMQPKHVYYLIGYFLLVGLLVTTYYVAKLIVPLFF